MIEIKPCCAAEILAEENSGLISAYAAESAIAGMPEPRGVLPMYQLLEQTGAARIFGAYRNGLLIGFAVALQQTLPHYGTKTTITESLFVLPEHRKTGAGAKLIRCIETAWPDSSGVLISAPAGGVLTLVLPGMGYRHTNQVFFKGADRA